jgi:hypothetical protein
MLESVIQAVTLARRFSMPLEDVLLISLNACGLRTDLGTPRARLRLRMKERPADEFRLILATGRPFSPFTMDEDMIYLNSEPIANFREIQDDLAVIGYFRRQGTVITLNSNARSYCTGCAFCPNTMEGAFDKPRLTVDELVTSLKFLARSRGLEDLSSIVEVNLSTGCLAEEDAALDHLKVVRNALWNVSSTAQIGFLSSVLRSTDVFEAIAESIHNFHLVLTIECFQNRDLILKSTKSSLTPEQMPDVLRVAKEVGHDTDFTYIVGLDNPDVAFERFHALLPYLTRFPNFQVYQPHSGVMDTFCTQGADNLEFYLHFRQRLEALFLKTELRPLSWENYRPLWYFEFAGEPMSCIRS